MKGLEQRTLKESYLYERTGDEVRCSVCERRCSIPEGEFGHCLTRKNINGRLHTVVYGDISACESRPIEIKPFFHFYPGSTALTFSTWSCNFLCPWCQNFHLSKTKPKMKNSNYIEPEEMVRLALDSGDEGLCASFQEPTMLFEYLCDVFELASKRGLYNSIVSNGYMTTEALRMLKNRGLDAIKIDLKGNDEVYRKYCGVTKSEAIWRNIHEAKKLGLHVEVVNLVITDVNDDKDCIKGIIERHLEFAGEETPLHFTRYYPAYKFHNPPTEVEILEDAYETAKSMGILYPYLGNVPSHAYENTYCQGCNEVVLKRRGYDLTSSHLTKDNRCPNCNLEIPVVGTCTPKKWL